MKRSITKLAIAASVVVATVIGMHLFDGTSGTTWAKVLIKVNGFDTCVYRSREVETTGPRPDGFEFADRIGVEKLPLRDLRDLQRENYKNGELFARHYMMLQEKQHLSLAGYEQGDMLCVRMALTERSLREFRDHDPRQIVARILAGDYVELGQDTTEGKRVRGVELRDPNVLTLEGEKTPPLDEFSSRFWIDAETALPVWMEISFVCQGSAQQTTMILDQFEWGVPLGGEPVQARNSTRRRS